MEKKSLAQSSVKVLYVSPNGYLGGAEKFVISAAMAHLATGKLTPILLFFKEGEAVTEVRKLGLECHVLSTSFRLSNPFTFFRALREIRSLVRRVQPDILHHTMAYGHLVMSIALLGSSVPRVWFQHGPVGGILDKLATIFPADYVLFNGSYLRRLHHAAFPHLTIRRGEAIIPLGVASGEAPRTQSQHRPLVFGMAGRISRGKGFHRPLQILSESGKEFQLLIAGSPKTSDDETYFSELKDLVQELGISSKVTFLGHITEMQPFYRQVDVFVHASDFPEPFGLVLAEAMGHGCLTIGRSGGGSDFLLNLETGLTYSSWEELRFVLLKVLDQDLREWERIAHNGQELIRHNYSPERMRDALEKIYFELAV